MIITNVAGIPIEFVVEDLSMNLKTRNDVLYLYTCRNKFDYPWYLIVDDVQNIYRWSDLSEEFCNFYLESEVLPLQVQILHSVL